MAGRGGAAHEAEPWFQALVEAGDTRAMVCVGDAAYTDHRPAEAEPWYLKAAERGDTEAMLRLAQFHWDARVSASRTGDDAEMRRWLLAAADGGNVAAMTRLAAHSTGAERERWYRRAAEAGDTWAAVSLADLLAERDGAEAERWYRRAMTDGGLFAATRLARLFDRQERFDEAVEAYRAAAEAGATEAMAPLIDLLERLGRSDEAGGWQRRLDAELASRSEGTVTGAAPWFAVVATAVLTTAVLPFVQGLVAKAAEDTYVAVRQGLRRLFHRSGGAPADHYGGELLIVQDPDPSLNLALHLWTDSPPEAIRALADLDLTEREPGGTGLRRVFWNQQTKRWESVRG
ncbi:hypothetical protein Val02_05360 [Virgisporangium aliadipatigenens]|uniref:Sel1 repeat family protein n=1 Tax=Virgisporangium aliadipatigenens TaxID=741659 RepID=A0A8J3YGM4_9ACTN|nr:tetratricopeptide repeat protein [Virgisporangium aliadipatigenens]GIJ43650.1 hypothetical protein Val02_05360 [Virgisporangium aliadipatigenens]